MRIKGWRGDSATLIRWVRGLYPRNVQTPEAAEEAVFPATIVFMVGSRQNLVTVAELDCEQLDEEDVVHRVRARIEDILEEQPLDVPQRTMKLSATVAHGDDIEAVPWGEAGAAVVTFTRADRLHDLMHTPGKAPSQGETFEIHQRLWQLPPEVAREAYRLVRDLDLLEGMRLVACLRIAEALEESYQRGLAAVQEQDD